MLRIVIPIAGQATRIGGTLKFLLPIPYANTEYSTLLKRLISLGSSTFLNCPVIVVTRHENVSAVAAYLETQCSKQPTLVSVCSRTMSETVLAVGYKQLQVDARVCTLVLMGDTFFTDAYLSCAEMYRVMQSDDKITAVLLLHRMRDDQRGRLGQVKFDSSTKDVTGVVDKSPDCALPYAWGAIMYRGDFEQFIQPDDPHIGHAIMPAICAGKCVRVVLSEGVFYDCGTLSEYVQMLQSAQQNGKQNPQTHGNK